MGATGQKRDDRREDPLVLIQREVDAVLDSRGPSKALPRLVTGADPEVQRVAVAMVADANRRMVEHNPLFFEQLTIPGTGAAARVVAGTLQLAVQYGKARPTKTRGQH